jgi:hypothetical protein
MRFFRDILLILRRCLLFFLLFYWAIFIGYTIAKYIDGGPRNIMAFYWYIACQHRLEPCPMNWGAFWFAQGVYLAITLLLCSFEWRSLKARTAAGRT